MSTSRNATNNADVLDRGSEEDDYDMDDFDKSKGKQTLSPTSNENVKKMSFKSKTNPTSGSYS